MVDKYTKLWYEFNNGVSKNGHKRQRRQPHPDRVKKLIGESVKKTHARKNKKKKRNRPAKSGKGTRQKTSWSFPHTKVKMPIALVGFLCVRMVFGLADVFSGCFFPFWAWPEIKAGLTWHWTILSFSTSFRNKVKRHSGCIQSSIPERTGNEPSWLITKKWGITLCKKGKPGCKKDCKKG